MSSTTTTTQIGARTLSLPALTYTGLGALLLALSAQVRVPLPGTPVPVTLQTYMVLVLGGWLGSRLGASAACAYLLLGLVGLPWFAGVTLGPTLGYLLGFVAAAIWVGRLKSDNTVSIFLHMLGGQGLIYLCGVTGLSFFVGAQNAFAAGVIPFVASDLLKVIAAALTVRLIKTKTKSRQNVA